MKGWLASCFHIPELWNHILNTKIHAIEKNKNFLDIFQSNCCANAKLFQPRSAFSQHFLWYNIYLFLVRLDVIVKEDIFIIKRGPPKPWLIIYRSITFLFKRHSQKSSNLKQQMQYHCIFFVRAVTFIRSSGLISSKLI